MNWRITRHYLLINYKKLEICQCDTDALPGPLYESISLYDMTDSLILTKFRLTLQHVNIQSLSSSIIPSCNKGQKQISNIILRP